MNRGRIESAGPKDLRKFKAVYTIFEKGYITQEADNNFLNNR